MHFRGASSAAARNLCTGRYSIRRDFTEREKEGILQTRRHQKSIKSHRADHRMCTVGHDNEWERTSNEQQVYTVFSEEFGYRPRLLLRGIFLWSALVKLHRKFHLEAVSDAHTR